MPNWCNNSLIVKGKKEDLGTFKTKYKGTFTGKKEDITWLDFTKIIPNKEDKDKWKPEWEKLTADEKQKWKNDFDNYWFNMSGHKWQSDNWGTKWNADIGEPREEDGKLYYGFSTAWSPCDEIVRTLIEKHPELEFEFEFEEWGEQFKGEITGENGEVLTDITENCDIAECPDCEMTNLKAVDEEEFVCGDCGKIFTKEESEKAEQERENGE